MVQMAFNEDLESLQAMMQLSEALTPVLDMAEGFKKTMIDRGWSTETAEAAGGLVLCGALSHIFGIPQAKADTNE